MMLQDKVSIITGGSMGIGKAIATAFAREGSSLVLVARSRPQLEATKQELSIFNSRVEILSADVSKEKEVNEIVPFTMGKYHTVDILVTCAGVLGPLGLVTDNDSEQWLQAININVFGTFLCIKAVLPIMMKNNKGKIITFSGGGDTPRPRRSAYSTSKAAIIRLTEAIAIEMKEYKIDINAIAPGSVNTRFLHQRLAAGNVLGEEEIGRAMKQLQEGGVPPERVAELSVFLASSQSDGLSGKEISLLNDNWREIPRHLGDITSSDIYTLRRIAPQDRGCKW